VSLAIRVLIGLLLGLGAGIAASSSHSPALLAASSYLEPLGTLFINAIRMTVIPLVVASVIVGVASSPDTRSLGSIGWRALALAVLMLFAAAIFSVLIGQPALARLHIDPAAAAALRATAAGSSITIAEGSKKLPTFSQWLVELVPANPFKAASDGAILPLIIFSLLFGLAITRLDDERRVTLSGFFQAVRDAMLVLVGWVLALAPIGVFALALPLATRMGAAAFGVLAFYVVLVSAMSTVFVLLVLYPAAVIGGRVPLRVFARASAPAQAVAFSSRSSLAALPAMMQGTAEKLASPPVITDFFIPLAASTYRVGVAIALPVGVLFIARLYGISIGPAQLVTVILTVVLTTFSVPGIPGGGILVMVPALLAAGVPVEGIGLLLAIDTIPDMFRTTTNVTGDMSAAAILGRSSGAKIIFTD